MQISGSMDIYELIVFFFFLFFVNHGARLRVVGKKNKEKQYCFMVVSYGEKNKEKQTSYFIALILLEICRIIKGYNFRLGSLV